MNEVEMEVADAVESLTSLASLVHTGSEPTGAKWHISELSNGHYFVFAWNFRTGAILREHEIATWQEAFKAVRPLMTGRES